MTVLGTGNPLFALFRTRSLQEEVALGAAKTLDRITKTGAFGRFVRQLPMEERIPARFRYASYCLGMAALMVGRNEKIANLMADFESRTLGVLVEKLKPASEEDYYRMRSDLTENLTGFVDELEGDFDRVWLHFAKCVHPRMKEHPEAWMMLLPEMRLFAECQAEILEKLVGQPGVSG